MKAIYTDGSEQTFDADGVEINDEQFVKLVKHQPDKDGDYDEDDDVEVVLLNVDSLRALVY